MPGQGCDASPSNARDMPRETVPVRQNSASACIYGCFGAPRVKPVNLPSDTLRLVRDAVVAAAGSATRVESLLTASGWWRFTRRRRGGAQKGGRGGWGRGLCRCHHPPAHRLLLRNGADEGAEVEERGHHERGGVACGAGLLVAHDHPQPGPPV
eukprot:8436384-Pyramimonas_sp.AAC.2